MFEARTISISIDRPWRDVYEAIWRPEFFPAWASGLSTADLRLENGVWLATGPGGPVEIAFTAHNDFGVMDHTVRLGDGRTVFVPLRIVPNGLGAEVIVTVFGDPAAAPEVIARDLAWVQRDLEALRRLVSA